MDNPNNRLHVSQMTVEQILAIYYDPKEIRLDELLEQSQQLRKDQWRERFALIRQAYIIKLPQIMERARKGLRVSPYFIEWDFSPIEYNAWCEIRGLALPFYPQVPVAGFFLDFADPVKKICIELDGKEFHDAAKDAVRDAKLHELGWEVFRISGQMARTYTDNYLPERLTQEDLTEDEEDQLKELQDSLRTFTIDGFFKWLKKTYYTKPVYLP